MRSTSSRRARRKVTSDGALAISRDAKPELYLGSFGFETRRVDCPRGNVVPVTRTVARFHAVERQYQLASCDHADVVRRVAVRRDHGAGRIRREQDVAVLRLEPEGIERSLELRKVTQLLREMGHMTHPASSL